MCDIIRVKKAASCDRTNIAIPFINNFRKIPHMQIGTLRYYNFDKNALSLSGNGSGKTITYIASLDVSTKRK